jgi:phage-related protein
VIVADVLTPIVDFLGWAAETKTADWFRDLADGIREVGAGGPIIAGVLDLLADLFTGESIFDVLDNASRMFGDLVTSMTQPFVDGYELISATVGQITGFLVSAWSGIVQVASDLWGGLGETLGGILKIIVGLFTGNFALVRQEVSGFLSTVSGWWNQTWSNILGVVQSIWAGIAGAIQGGVNNAVGLVQSLPGRIIGALQGAASWLYSVGQDIVRGLISGVTSMIGRAVETIRNLASSMVANVKDWLGIHSPSRVMRDQVGAPMAQGLIEGIKANIPEIESILRAAVALPEVPSIGGTAGATINVEQTIVDNDPRLFARQFGREFSLVMAGMA